MSFILLIYLVTPETRWFVTKIGPFTSIEKCFKASQNVTVSPGPGKLAFNCEEQKESKI